MKCLNVKTFYISTEYNNFIKYYDLLKKNVKSTNPSHEFYDDSEYKVKLFNN